MRFRFLIVPALSFVPVMAFATPPIEVKVEGWPWKFPVPDGFCLLDQTKAPDKALFDFSQKTIPPSGVQMALVVDCAELQAFRKGDHPPRHTLAYNVTKDEAMQPFVRSMSRLAYIHGMVQQMPVVGTKNLAATSEKDLKDKTGVDVSIPRLSVIGQDEYAFYAASVANVPAQQNGKAFSVATVSAGTKIGMHVFAVVLTRPYDTDRIFTTMLDESKAVTKDFLHVNPY